MGGLCETCRFSDLLRDWREHFDGATYLALLDGSQHEALGRVAEASEEAVGTSHEPRRLKEEAAFEALRIAARVALASLG